MIWTPPEDPKGPIDGYRVGFLERAQGENPTQWQDVHRDTHFAELKNLTEGAQYVIHVIAFNRVPGFHDLESAVAIVNAETRGKCSSTKFRKALENEFREPFAPFDG